jgi:hypothetical protein
VGIVSDSFFREYVAGGPILYLSFTVLFVTQRNSGGRIIITIPPTTGGTAAMFHAGQRKQQRRSSGAQIYGNFTG